MDELLRRSPCGGDEVVPAAGDKAFRVKTEDAVGEGIAVVVVVEEPAIKVGIAQEPTELPQGSCGQS